MSIFLQFETNAFCNLRQMHFATVLGEETLITMPAFAQPLLFTGSDVRLFLESCQTFINVSCSPIYSAHFQSFYSVFVDSQIYSLISLHSLCYSVAATLQSCKMSNLLHGAKPSNHTSYPWHFASLLHSTKQQESVKSRVDPMTESQLDSPGCSVYSALPLPLSQPYPIHRSRCLQILKELFEN